VLNNGLQLAWGINGEGATNVRNARVLARSMVQQIVNHPVIEFQATQAPGYNALMRASMLPTYQTTHQSTELLPTDPGTQLLKLSSENVKRQMPSGNSNLRSACYFMFAMQSIQRKTVCPLSPCNHFFSL
jgi:hypothetical protein